MRVSVGTSALIMTPELDRHAGNGSLRDSEVLILLLEVASICASHSLLMIDGDHDIVYERTDY